MPTGLKTSVLLPHTARTCQLNLSFFLQFFLLREHANWAKDFCATSLLHEYANWTYDLCVIVLLQEHAN
jgi:hypothetical protein